VNQPCSYWEQEAKHMVSGVIDDPAGVVRVRPTGESSPPARNR
jgi:hypothetical protein